MSHNLTAAKNDEPQPPRRSSSRNPLLDARFPQVERSRPPPAPIRPVQEILAEALRVLDDDGVDDHGQETSQTSSSSSHGERNRDERGGTRQ